MNVRFFINIPPIFFRSCQEFYLIMGQNNSEYLTCHGEIFLLHCSYYTLIQSQAMKKLTLTLFGFFFFQSTAYTQENLEASVDCTNVQIDYADDSTLTRGERIHHMDQALNKSLSKFELCQSEKKKVGSSGANGNPGGTGDLTGSSEGGATSGSVASSAISGTELPASEDTVKDKKPEVSTAVQATNNENGKYESSTSIANGKLPDDIPSADNDSVLAAQIRRAAENETDPTKREQLWNEYRKYKGLTQ